MRKTLQLLVLLLLLCHGYSYAQASKISGKITSATNEALIGVSIVVSGTGQGTVSDVDGNYALTAPDDATLVFSYVGYVSQTVAVKGRSSINIIMATDSKELGEVVVTALGIKKDERKVGYAVTKVDGGLLNGGPRNQRGQLAARPGSWLERSWCQRRPRLVGAPQHSGRNVVFGHFFAADCYQRCAHGQHRAR